MSAPPRTTLAPGLGISRIVTGLWQVADAERDGATLDADAAVRDLRTYVDAGFTTFDMADHYGSAEEIAGRLGGDGTERLTKWVPPPGALSPETVRAGVQRALDRLRTDRIDLLQFHAWRWSDPAWLDGLFALANLRREGRILHLGVTNFDTAHLRVALTSGIPIVSNQVCWSLLDTRPARGMADLCTTHGVGLLAYGTVAGGFLTDRWLDAERPATDGLTWSQMKYLRFIDATGGWDAFQSVLRVARDVAAKHGVSIANVACRHILDQPGVAGIIVGARPGVRSHLEDNLRILELHLDDDDRAALHAASATLDPIPGDCGDEYRRPPFLTAAGDLSHHFETMPPPYASRPGPVGRTRVLSGTVWEDLGGFSRAMRAGSRITVSGTTATHGDRVIGGGDPAAQAHFILDKIEGAITSLGGRLEDVIRTRIYVRRMEDWEAVARVHGERLGHVQPANTLVRADLVGDDYLVEMEAEAEVAEPRLRA